MYKIFLDLEMNPVANLFPQVQAEFKQEIIEIGAVKYDENDTYIDSFCSYIRPQFNDTIERHIYRLTGITDQRIIVADSFEQTIQRFLEWCGQNARAYCWSENDTIQLHDEASYKNSEFIDRLNVFLDEWVDVQQLFCAKSGVTRNMNLSKAADLIALEIEGHIHDALTDARVTAKVYYELEKGSAINAVRNCMASETESIGTSLASLIAGIGFTD